MERIRADCIVDDLGDGEFEVTVTGLAPYDHRRVYAIRAVSDNKAAFECLRRFTEEMEALYEGSTPLNGHTRSLDHPPAGD